MEKYFGQLISIVGFIGLFFHFGVRVFEMSEGKKKKILEGKKKRTHKRKEVPNQRNLDALSGMFCI